MNKGKKSLVGAAVVGALLLQPTASFATVDLIHLLDTSVISLHNYSTTSAKISATSAESDIRNQVNSLNAQLSTIRANITNFDGYLAKSWNFLDAKANPIYPQRSLLRQFDTQLFAWYNFELGEQKSVVTCFAKAATAKKCTLAVRAAKKGAETKAYAALNSTLTQIEKWRLANKR